jgi:predicted alpha/beta-hydrolase family hydrolase
MTRSATVEQFSDLANDPPVRGFLHTPAPANGNALVLAHSAGSDCQSKLLQVVSAAFADAGFLVLRVNLPFRQERPHGPPFPGGAARDRECIHRAVEVLKERTSGTVYLGGHSYGGRQATMLAAEQPNLVAGLLLLSYPLHPPRKLTELRTSHFPRLSTPALFVHGSRDPFGLLEEMTAALELIPGRHRLLAIEGAGHELLGRKTSPNFPDEVVSKFLGIMGLVQ